MIDLRLGDCRDIIAGLDLSAVKAVVADPPYGMDWDTDSTRYSGGSSKEWRYRGRGRNDWGDVLHDDEPFDPTPWLGFPKVILWGSNHFGARLPVGSTLIWVKKDDHHFGTFLSDAEIAWMKGGYGVYCFRKNFATPSRIKEGGGKVLHPNQKPVALMRWCLERLKLRPGDLVLDPYMGSGTTGVAAVQLELDFIGIELDPGHFETASRRIKSESGRHPMFDVPGARDTYLQNDMFAQF